MKVFIVDDTESFAEMFKQLLQVEGYEVQVCNSLKDAYQAFQAVEEPVVVFLDHDFSDSGEQQQIGYDLCQWLRENHPFGLLLPIIYLSGREVPERFVRQQRDNPFVHPSAYVSKDQLASDPDLIPELLKKYAEQFERIRELFENQSARQALMSFEKMEPETDDED